MSRSQKAAQPRVAGASVVAQRARPTRVLATLGHLAPAFLIVLAPPLAAAGAEGAYGLALALAWPAAAALALTAARGLLPAVRDLRGVEALCLVALSFVLAAAAAVPAFVALGMAPEDAAFEAVSAITTTGLSVAADSATWPLSAHFLRAWLQWCGGLAFLASALALLVGPGVVARRLAEAGMPSDDDRFASARTRAAGVLALYAGATAVAAAAAAGLARDPLDGVLLALSAVSTGGFAPDAPSLGAEGRALQGVVIAACLLGAVSFPLLLRARRRGPSVLWRDPALRLMAILVGAATLGVGLSVAANDSAAWTDAAISAASALTTAGFSSVEVGAYPPVALAILMTVMLVGGDVGSTAGGLKLTRLVVSIAAFRLTLSRAQAPPGAVVHLRALGQRFDTDELAAIAGLAFAYAVCALALWLGFLAAGAPALPALFDVTSALSTVGLSAGVVGPATPAPLKLGVTLAMMLGRLEFFALILLLSPGVWMKRKG